jgi:hypothetical protein
MTAYNPCRRAARTGILIFSFAALTTAAPIIVDDFSTDQTLNLSALGANPKHVRNNAAGGVGGGREFTLTRTAGTGNAQLDSNTFSPGFLSYASSDVADAQFLVVWDGSANTTASATANLSAVTGLAFDLNLDLTDGGANTLFRIRADADNNGNVPLMVRIYTSATKYVTGTTTVDGDVGFTLGVYDMLFTSFVGTGLGVGETALDVLRNTKAIALYGNAPQASDLSIDFVGSTSMVPEPTTMALIGTAIVGLGLARRRRLL